MLRKEIKVMDTSKITGENKFASDFVEKVLNALLPHFSAEANRLFSCFGILGALLGFAVFATASLLHSEIQQVSMFTNMVSSLGWGPNGSHEVFKFGLLAVGLALFPYVLFLISGLRNSAPAEKEQETISLTHKAATFWFIAVSGLWLLAGFIDIRVPDFKQAMMILGIHALGAVLYFSCSIVGVFYLNKALALNHWPHKLQNYILVFIVFSSLSMAAGFTQMQNAGKELGIMEQIQEQGMSFILAPQERTDLIYQATSMAPWGAFFEWMVVLAMLLWFLVTGVQTFCMKKNRNAC
jgi:hypothetical protein